MGSMGSTEIRMPAYPIEGSQLLAGIYCSLEIFVIGKLSLILLPYMQEQKLKT